MGVRISWLTLARIPSLARLQPRPDLATSSLFSAAESLAAIGLQAAERFHQSAFLLSMGVIVIEGRKRPWVPGRRRDGCGVPDSVAFAFAGCSSMIKPNPSCVAQCLHHGNRSGLVSRSNTRELGDFSTQSVVWEQATVLAKSVGQERCAGPWSSTGTPRNVFRVARTVRARLGRLGLRARLMG